MKITKIEVQSLQDRFAGRLRPDVAKCTVCGRILKDPVSIAAGMGPVCAGKKGRTIQGGMNMTEAQAHVYHDELLDNPIDPFGVILQRTGPRILAASKVRTNVPHLFYHGSPDGFEWGYGGSGPNDLAWNIAEWFLRHLGWDGEKTTEVHSRDEVFMMSWRFKREILMRWIAGMPDRGGHIPYLELRHFFEGAIANYKLINCLPWETPEQARMYNSEEDHARMNRTGEWRELDYK